MSLRRVPIIAVETYAAPRGATLEIVERKGLGHPDSIADAISEALQDHISEIGRSVARRPAVPYAYVDKTLVICGVAEPRWGGGRIVSPCRVVAPCLVERTTPLDGCTATIRKVFASHVPHYPVNLIKCDVLRRSPSGHSLRTYAHQPRDAEDSCVVVASAPQTELERIVLSVEQVLVQKERDSSVGIGTDIKLLVTRHEADVHATVAVAFRDAVLHSLRDYRDAKALVTDEIKKVLSGRFRSVKVDVNPDDRFDLESVYLTVTGSSIEGGDCGMTGRGNRGGGVIVPFGAMTLEAEAGKPLGNHPARVMKPVTQAIADAVAQMDGISRAEVALIAQVGIDLRRPAAVMVRVFGKRPPGKRAVATLVESQLRVLGMPRYNRQT